MSTGRFEEALTELRRAAALTGAEDPLKFAILYALWGKKEEAGPFLARALERGRPGYVQPTHLAQAYAALGNHAEAIRWLRKGLAEGAPYMAELKVEPGYDPLRAEPGFQAILRQLRLDR